MGPAWPAQPSRHAPRHGVWVGPQQGLGVGAPSGQCLYPESLAGQSWHCGSRPAHPGSGVQRPPSPAWTRGFARGGRLSRAPEDLAGAPPSSREGLHLDGHLGCTPSLTRWRQHGTAAQRCREVDPAPQRGAGRPPPVPGSQQAHHACRTPQRRRPRLSAPPYREGSASSEKLSDAPKVTQLGSSEARI